MHLSFLYDSFPNYDLEFHENDGSEYAYISRPDFKEAIRIYYEPDDFDKYCLVFATQHLHISDEESLVRYADSFANAKLAAVEFYGSSLN